MKLQETRQMLDGRMDSIRTTAKTLGATANDPEELMGQVTDQSVSAYHEVVEHAYPELPALQARLHSGLLNFPDNAFHDYQSAEQQARGELTEAYRTQADHDYDQSQATSTELIKLGRDEAQLKEEQRKQVVGMTGGTTPPEKIDLTNAILVSFVILLATGIAEYFLGFDTFAFVSNFYAATAMSAGTVLLISGTAMVAGFGCGIILDGRNRRQRFEENKRLGLVGEKDVMFEVSTRLTVVTFVSLLIFLVTSVALCWYRVKTSMGDAELGSSGALSAFAIVGFGLIGFVLEMLTSPGVEPQHIRKYQQNDDELKKMEQRRKELTAPKNQAVEKSNGKKSKISFGQTPAPAAQTPEEKYNESLNAAKLKFEEERKRLQDDKAEEIRINSELANLARDATQRFVAVVQTAWYAYANGKTDLPTFDAVPYKVEFERRIVVTDPDLMQELRSFNPGAAQLPAGVRITDFGELRKQVSAQVSAGRELAKRSINI